MKGAPWKSSASTLSYGAAACLGAYYLNRLLEEDRLEAEAIPSTLVAVMSGDGVR
jgi:hypothetical protein